MGKANKQQNRQVAKHPVKRLVMLMRGKWRYINYNAKFPRAQCWKGWKPTFNSWWMGDIWEAEWRGHAISVDMRSNWVADMINPNRTDRHKA